MYRHTGSAGVFAPALDAYIIKMYLPLAFSSSSIDVFVGEAMNASVM